MSVYYRENYLLAFAVELYLFLLFYRSLDCKKFFYTQKLHENWSRWVFWLVYAVFFFPIVVQSGFRQIESATAKLI